MSAHEVEVTEEEAEVAEGNEENTIRFFSDLVYVKIKASLEPLHSQISALTEMMNRLIQTDSARETTTASSRETRHEYESPFIGVPESFKFPTVALLTTARYSPDTSCQKFCEVSYHFVSVSMSKYLRDKVQFCPTVPNFL